MNILLVNNLRSGMGDSGVFDFVRELGAKRCEVTMRFLNEGADIRHLLRDAGDYNRVVAAGGDGTVSSVAYALHGTGIPLLAYPAGTGNLIARNLNLPLDPVELAMTTIAGRTVTIDLGEMTLPAKPGMRSTTRGFLIAAGAGFDASIMEAAQGLKQSLGEGAYIIGAMQNLAPKMSRFTLTLDDEVIETDGIAVLLMNLARTQFDLVVAHGADAQDGLLEVVIIKTPSPAGLLPAIWAALMDRLGEHPDRPGLDIRTASRVEVLADPPLPIEYDGEVVDGYATPFSATIIPRAATFIVSDATLLPHDQVGAGADDTSSEHSEEA